MKKKIFINDYRNPETPWPMGQSELIELSDWQHRALEILDNQESVLLQGRDDESILEIASEYSSFLGINQQVVMVCPESESLKQTKLALGKSFREEQIKTYQKRMTKGMLRPRVRFLLITLRGLGHKATFLLKNKGGLLVFHRCLGVLGAQNIAANRDLRWRFDRTVRGLKNHTCLFSIASPNGKLANRISKTRECRILR